MGKFLIIPQLDNISESLALAEKYDLGFEFNDFFMPDVLDDEDRLRTVTERYKSCGLPEYCTMHGDFFDVIIFSEDKRICEISELRIRQSIECALKLGAKGVVFHTNYTPCLTSASYVEKWHSTNFSFWSGILAEYPQINIYMENMFDRKPDMLVRLAESLKDFDNFGICYDYAHASVFGEDVDIWTEAVAPYVKHMHINDNDLKDDLHLAVGDGQIDWDKFRDYYNRYFTECTVLIETSSLENQRRSLEFLHNIGII